MTDLPVGQPVNVHLLEALFPTEDSSLRVHKDDQQRLEHLLTAVYALLHSGRMRVEAVSDYQTRFEMIPEAGLEPSDRLIEPGLYAVVRITGIDEEAVLARTAEPPAPPKALTDEQSQILNAVSSNWDWSGEHPMPAMETLRCLCGNTSWSPRYWIYHDYANTDEPESHRFRFRCDVSMKCVTPKEGNGRGCGFVGTWGVIVPDDWWVARQKKPIKVSWREVKGAAARGGK